MRRFKISENFHLLVHEEDGSLQRLRDLVSLPGSQIVNRILDAEHPGDFIQKLPCEDFFWLVKKVGEEDSLALLQLASVDQWEYLLDLEIWEKDRLNISHTSHWMGLLQQANCRQLVRWLFSEGEYLAYYHFFRTLEVVVISDKDEVFNIPDGLFSLDGVFYMRVFDPQYRQTMENIIRVMADEDLTRYQALLLGLAGVLPAEVEEEMYRLRNVRLAEHRGGILEGLLAKRPRYYVGPDQKEEYRDFELLSDLRECLNVLRELMVLDGLLEKLVESYPLVSTSDLNGKYSRFVSIDTAH